MSFPERPTSTAFEEQRAHAQMRVRGNIQATQAPPRNWELIAHGFDPHPVELPLAFSQRSVVNLAVTRATRVVGSKW
jgi:hypothetical protein